MEEQNVSGEFEQHSTPVLNFRWQHLVKKYLWFSTRWSVLILLPCLRQRDTWNWCCVSQRHHSGRELTWRRKPNRCFSCTQCTSEVICFHVKNQQNLEVINQSKTNILFPIFSAFFIHDTWSFRCPKWKKNWCPSHLYQKRHLKTVKSKPTAAAQTYKSQLNVSSSLKRNLLPWSITSFLELSAVKTQTLRCFLLIVLGAAFMLNSTLTSLTKPSARWVHSLRHCCHSWRGIQCCVSTAHIRAACSCSCRRHLNKDRSTLQMCWYIQVNICNSWIPGLSLVKFVFLAIFSGSWISMVKREIVKMQRIQTTSVPVSRPGLLVSGMISEKSNLQCTLRHYYHLTNQLRRLDKDCSDIVPHEHLPQMKLEKVSCFLFHSEKNTQPSLPKSSEVLKETSKD